ncbi:hypothetical protein K1W54_04415 [Micromonospora sp. CPCC 205371]|nr:hypothetical protein [Micromonospora sp. CPCC 205371]
MIITWALQTQTEDQSWDTNSLNPDPSDYLASDDLDITDPQKLAQQIAERIGIDTDTAELVNERGLLRIAVWMGEDASGEPDGTYGSLDVLGLPAS